MREPKTRDRARWFEVGLNSEHVLPRGSAALSVGLWHGLDIFGATKASSQLAARLDGKPDFTLVRAGANVTLSPTQLVVLSVGAAAQYGFDPVPAAVRFAIGGEPFGRAFDSSTIAGDSGIAGSVEVGLNDLFHPPGAHITPFAFGDAGVVWNRGDLMDYDRASIASVGLGLRAVFPPGTMAQASVALPVHVSNKEFGEGLRLFFRIGQKF